MNVLFGVVGEGMGHATRSRVSIEHLLQQGHHVRVVVSGRAHALFQRVFQGRERITIHEIHGLTLSFDGMDLDLSDTLVDNLSAAPAGLIQNLRVLSEIVEDGFHADVVISDFESWAYLYGRTRGIPVISIDNMQILNRCEHPPFAKDFGHVDYRLAKLAVKSKLPGAYHYLVSTFFVPKVKKPRTTLIPPILRPEILKAVRAPGEHVLVYVTSATAGPDLAPILHSLPYPFVVYGAGHHGQEGNITYREFSETGFVEDLRTATAVIANGGFSLMCEAVHLRVPMLSIPLSGQFEQQLNARYLSWLGYGMMSETLAQDPVRAFLEWRPRYAEQLQAYLPRDNSILTSCLDELLERIGRGEARPSRLTTRALARYDD